MTAQNPNTESIFWAALAVESIDDRAKYLEQVCGADQLLRGRVEELLAAHPKVARFLEPRTSDVGTAIAEPAVSEAPSAIIGPYKLLQELGAGGMGTVYMAEQSVPVQRTVALTIINPGMD